MSTYSLVADEIKILHLRLMCQVSNHSFLRLERSSASSSSILPSRRLDGVAARWPAPHGGGKCCKNCNISAPQRARRAKMLQIVQLFRADRGEIPSKCCSKCNISPLSPPAEPKMLHILQHFGDRPRLDGGNSVPLLAGQPPHGGVKCCKNCNISAPQRARRAKMLQIVQLFRTIGARSRANAAVNATFPRIRRRRSQKCCTLCSILGLAPGWTAATRRRCSLASPPRRGQMLQKLQHFSAAASPES